MTAFKVLTMFMCSVHCLCEPKGILDFPELQSTEHTSDIKLFASKIAKCFSCGAISHRDVVLLGFFHNFSKSLLAMHYTACSYLFAWHTQGN